MLIRHSQVKNTSYNIFCTKKIPFNVLMYLFGQGIAPCTLITWQKPAPLPRKQNIVQKLCPFTVQGALLQYLTNIAALPVTYEDNKIFKDTALTYTLLETHNLQWDTNDGIRSITRQTLTKYFGLRRLVENILYKLFLLVIAVCSPQKLLLQQH